MRSRVWIAAWAGAFGGTRKQFPSLEVAFNWARNLAFSRFAALYLYGILHRMMLSRVVREQMRAPKPALACILILGLGICISSAMFTLIYSLLLRPLPYKDPESLASVQPRISWGDALRIEAYSKTVAAIGVYRKRTWGFADGGGPAQVVISGMVTHGFFEALSVKPDRGAMLTEAQEHSGNNKVMWLSNEFWAERYARRLDVIGRVVTLNDIEYRIVGVLPRSFRFSMDGEIPDIYFPLDRSDYCCQPELRTLSGLLRLQPHTSLTGAETEIASITQAPLYVKPLGSAFLGRLAGPVILIGLASGLLMLVAATNAVAIMLTRAARNLQAAAIKVALGARIRNLLAEGALQGIVIALFAAALGLSGAVLLLAQARSLPVLSQALAACNNIAELRVDSHVVVFGVLVSLVAAVGASIAPIALLRKGLLYQQSRKGVSQSRVAVQARSLLVVVQIALASTLMSTGSVALTNVRSILTAKKGFDTQDVVIAGIGIPEKRYNTDLKMIDVHQRVIGDLQMVPGITGAAGGEGVPFGAPSQFQLPGQSVAKKDRPWAIIGVGTPNLFRFLRIPLVKGREFAAHDSYKHPLVALVNQEFENHFGLTVGSHVRVGFWNGAMHPWPDVAIIGVLANARNHEIDRPPEPAIYLNSLQVPMDTFHYFARTPLPPASIVTGFRQAVWDVDPNLEKVRVRSLDTDVENKLQPRWIVIWIVGVFGTIAFLLAISGVAASISAWVTESETEIGVRSALGAPAYAIVTRVIGRSVITVSLGLVLAIPLTFVAVSLINHRIMNQGQITFGPLAVVPAVLLAVSVLASVWPARRAANVNPLDVLRAAG